MAYTLPSGEHHLTGACAFDNGLCTWSGESSHLWRPDTGWTSLSQAPAPIDSGFELQSGMLAGADTHIGFFPSDGTDWAGWTDLSTFSDAHPMYGDLLLCTHADTESYILFSVSESGLDHRSTFSADELADPVAGWSPPTDIERLLLLGDGGLWALDPPYDTSSLQHLVSFDDVDLPPHGDIPGPFQPGRATVVIPRGSRTSLRLDLSDGTGHATGLKHLPGGAALWSAYLEDDRTIAARVLSILASLPAGPSGSALHLYDILIDDDQIQALATSAGLVIPAQNTPGTDPPVDLAASPLDTATLVTWGLWLGWEGMPERACRQLCNAPPNVGLVESLHVFVGPRVCEVLFDVLRSSEPPAGPSGDYHYPIEALRALVAPFAGEAAPLVASALTAPSVPARVAACAAAGTTRANGVLRTATNESASDASDDPTPLLWNDEHPLPREALRGNTNHDHPAVRTAARASCTRLGIGTPSNDYPRRSAQSSQAERPK